MSEHERVARALCTAHYVERFQKPADDPHVRMNVEANWQAFSGQAKTAIEAIGGAPSPVSHLMGGDLMESGQAFANQVRAIAHKLNGQAYSSTVSALNLFDAELRRARAAIAAATSGAWPIETEDQVEALARECEWNNRRFRELSSELCGPIDIWYGEADLGDHDIQDGVKHEYVLASELTALRDRCEKLEKVLEPFAKAGQVIDGPFGPALFREDDMAFQSGCAWSENGERRTITWGDFRAARAALAQDKRGGE